MEDERWKELVVLAAKEEDPDRLLELVRQINDLLEAREQRLRFHPSAEAWPQ